MVSNEKRMNDLEDHIEKTTPERPHILVYWGDDLGPGLVRFVPPGEDRAVIMTRTEFEEKYSEVARQEIEVHFLTREEVTEIDWPEDDVWPED